MKVSFDPKIKEKHRRKVSWLFLVFYVWFIHIAEALGFGVFHIF